MTFSRLAWATFLGVLLCIAISTAQVDLVKERGGYSAKLVRKFDVSPGGDLKMSNLIGDVTITGGNNNQVEVIQDLFLDVDTEQEAQRAYGVYLASVEKQGNAITVKGPEKSQRRYVTVSYNVKVPKKFNVDVQTTGGEVLLRILEGRASLETLGGDVEAGDVTGDLDVETAGGEITARNVEGVVILNTAGGEIALREARKGPFTLKTAGGGISLQTTSGTVMASTSGGNVTARNADGNLDLSTSGGEISLREVKGTSHTAKTSGGDVEAISVVGDVELKTSGGELLASNIEGSVYGRTSGGNVTVERVSGDADVSTSGGSLRLEDVTGRLSGKTSGGDVRAQLSKGHKLNGTMRLSSSGGEITLQLPGDVQATVDAEIQLTEPFSHYTVRSDFDLKIEEKKEERGSQYGTIRATGDINGGGPFIELRTTEGDIIIERRD